MDATSAHELLDSDDQPEDRRRVLVVGSSPICLLIALTASRSGYHVTLAERSDRLGGAWATDEVEGQLVDRACHLLEPLAPARAWVFEQLGEEPARYAHPPTVVTPWNSVWPIQSRRYRALELAMAYPAAMRHMISAIGTERDEFRRIFAECRHDIARLTRRTIRELWSGPSKAMTFSPQPFVRLCALATEAVDEVRLSQNVARISYLPRKKGLLATLNGVKEPFNHVVVPSGADVEIDVSGETVGRQQFHFLNHHLLFEAAPGTRDFSYVALMTDSRIRRVIDTSPGGSQNGRHRYLAHVRGDDVTVDDVVETLARHHYIDASAPAELLRHYRFTSTRTTFSAALPEGLWAPDTYGDLSDNLARMLVRDNNGDVRLHLPFAERPRLRRVR